MLFNLLRSLFRRNLAPQSNTAEQGLDTLGRRAQAILERLVELDRLGYLRYQVEAAALLGRLLADPRYDDRARLERFGFKVYSQNDEDGILAEVFRRIGTTNRQFLEVGAGQGLENNTRYLLEQGWSGAWMDGSRDYVSAIEKGFKHRIDAGRLSVRQAVVHRDNINDLVRSFALPRELDLLSVDIDGNDYHVWDAITTIEPRVVVIEYNAKFPPPMQWVMSYDPAHRWDGSDQFGASLEAIADLAQRKGYRLVGCNITGCNAFFVRAELAQRRFAEAMDAAALYQPARYFLTPAFVSGHPPGYGRT